MYYCRGPDCPRRPNLTLTQADFYFYLKIFVYDWDIDDEVAVWEFGATTQAGQEKKPQVRAATHLLWCSPVQLKVYDDYISKLIEENIKYNFT